MDKIGMEREIRVFNPAKNFRAWKDDGKKESLGFEENEACSDIAH